MSWREDRATGFMLLLLLYVIHTIAMYIYDKFRAAYYFTLDLYSKNSDVIFWLIIVIVAACFWYLCGWLGSKKMKRKKLENAKRGSTSEPEAKSEPIFDLEENYVPEIVSASKFGHYSKDNAISEVEVATSKQSIYKPDEASRSTPKIESSPNKITEVVSENGLQALSPTSAHPNSPESEQFSNPKYDTNSDEDLALAICNQLRLEGIDALPLPIEDYLKLLTEKFHMSENEAKRGALNYFRKYRKAEAQYESLSGDLYKSPKWIALARQIRKRDNFTCQRCGKNGPNDGGELHVHHIKPRGIGGSNDPSNLITLCSDCHSVQPHHERLRNK